MSPKHWVSGHYRENPKRRDDSFTIECAFCHGSGLDPHGIMGNEKCPAKCKGGWQTLSGVEDDYRRCGRCDGTGAVMNIVSTDPCKECHGTGLVKVR